MRFQKKLMITYSGSIFLVVLILSVAFWLYATRMFQNNALDFCRLLTNESGNQLDKLLEPLDFITTDILSDQDFKTAITILSNLENNNPSNSVLIQESRNIINKQLYTYSIMKHYYAIVVFNDQNNFFSSNVVEHNRVVSAEDAFIHSEWPQDAVLARGRLITLPPRKDYWIKNHDSLEIFGRGRAIESGNGKYTYLAAFLRTRKLVSIFNFAQKEYISVFAYLPDGTLIYSSEDPSVIEDLYPADTYLDRQGSEFVRNPENGRKEAVFSYQSENSNVIIQTILYRDLLLKPLRFIGWMISLLGSAVVLFSVSYIWISSRMLTRPLRDIQEKINNTDLANLNDIDPLKHDNDEITKLDYAFANLSRRLENSVRKELNTQTRWMKARLDSMQAQMNPHFINNILTVIASKGVEASSLEIPEICGSVASMLQYSTATTSGIARIDEEISHMERYLFLMKKRLKESLEYSISVDSSIKNIRIPKIIFQQIVENSIEHARSISNDVLILRIEGKVINDRWQIIFQDNGCGFSSEKLNLLSDQMNSIKKSPHQSIIQDGFEIGGMGLINTFARLFLYYQGDLDWEIDNLRNRGASVIIGGPFIDSPGGSVFV